MTDDVGVGEFIDDFLEHGLYNPVKAHEYYMRTRELKSRTQSSTPRSQLDFNDKVQLDTSQIQDRRAKNDPTRSTGKNNSKVGEAKKELDRIVSLIARVHAQQKKTHFYDLPKHHKLAKLVKKLLKEYDKQYAIVYQPSKKAS